MKKRTAIAVVLSCALLCSASAAQAKLLEVWASGLAGGVVGGGKLVNDFLGWSKGGAAGAEVGAKVLFLSAWVDYLRLFGGEAGAHLMSFNLGNESTWSFGLPVELVIRAALTYYLGWIDHNAPVVSGDSTGLDVRDVDTQGIGANAGIGLRYPFWHIFSLGITPTIGYHYFFTGASAAASKTDNNSSGWDFWALAYFRVALGI